MIGTVGSVLQIAGLLVSGAAAVVGAEEFVSDLVRPIRYEELCNDVRSAVFTVARESGKVNVVVIKEQK